MVREIIALLFFLNSNFFRFSIVRNVSEPLASWDKPTNNVAELRAAIRAIQIVKEGGLQNIT